MQITREINEVEVVVKRAEYTAHIILTEEEARTLRTMCGYDQTIAQALRDRTRNHSVPLDTDKILALLRNIFSAMPKEFTLANSVP